MTTGDRIKEARKKRGWTQAELANKLGISYVGVSQWENNQRNPKLETLRQIAMALEVPVSSLMPSTFSEVLEDETLQVFLDGIKKHLKPLNGIGQQKVSDFAIDYAIDLAKIPEYQNAPPEALQEASEGE